MTDQTHTALFSDGFAACDSDSNPFELNVQICTAAKEAIIEKLRTDPEATISLTVYRGLEEETRRLTHINVVEIYPPLGVDFELPASYRAHQAVTIAQVAMDTILLMSSSEPILLEVRVLQDPVELAEAA